MKRILLSSFLIPLIGAVVLFAPPALAGDDAVDFGLSVSTDYHLNQDGRPTPSYDFLVPLYTDEESLLFFNPRYHIDDETNTSRAEEWNLGLGYRRMILNDKAILGANVYYDWRRSMSGNQFEQVGAGLELMTENVTTRVNGYLALSGARELSRHRWREYYFAPRSINYNEYELVSWEVPTSGFDGEIGVRVPYLSDYCETWVYGGGYVFEPVASVGDAGTMEGIKGRVEVKPTDYVKASFEVRDDNVRGTAYYGEIVFEVPFSIENLVAGKNPFEGLKEKVVEPSYEIALADRMYETVERDPDIITGYNSATENVTNNGVLMAVRYVKNVTGTDVDVAGHGSYGSPYLTINYALDTTVTNNPFDPDAEALFVLAGNTTIGYDGFTVDATYGGDRTTIWGQGYKPVGVTAMPHSLGVVFPKITDTVTIDAADVEVTGLKFSPATGSWGMNVTDNGDRARIHHNQFYNTGYTTSDYGLRFVAGTGTYVENNTFTGNYHGIDIAAVDAAWVGGDAISSNTFTITRSGTAAWPGLIEPGIAAIYMNVPGSVANPVAAAVDYDLFTVRNNKITVKDTTTVDTAAPSVRGINLNVTGANDLYALIANNTLTVSSTSPSTTSPYIVEGIHAYAENELDVSITGNNLSGGILGKNLTHGISLGVRHDASGYSTLVEGLVAYNKLKVSNTDTTGAIGINDASGIYCFSFDTDLDVVKNDLSLGVTARGNASGIDIYTRAGGTGTYHIIDNTLKVTSSAEDAYGIALTTAPGAVKIDAVITGNNLSRGVSTTGTGTDDTAYGIYIACTGTVAAGGEITSIIGNNLLKVSSAGGDAYGIREESLVDTSNNDLLKTLVFGNNLATGAVTAKLNAYGIYLSSASDANIDIISNSFKVSSTYTGSDTGYGRAFGIWVYADTADDGHNLTGDVLSNTMSLGVSGRHETAGIWLKSGGFIYDFIVSGNTLKATSSAGVAMGIYGLAGVGLYPDIYINNLSTGGISGKTSAYGIALYSNNLLETDVLDNSLKVTSSTGDAFGLYVSSVIELMGRYNGNDLSAGVTGSTGAYGLLLTGNRIGWDGSVTDPLEICGNRIKSTAGGASGVAYGISMTADTAMFTDIVGNDLSYGISGKDNTYGMYLRADNSVGYYSTGYVVEPLIIADNRLKVTSTYTGTTAGHGEAYGIYVGSLDGNLLADIHDNNMRYGVSGKYLTAGIMLRAESGNIGTYWGGAWYETDKLWVDSNVIKATSSTGAAAGISIFADGIITNPNYEGYVSGWIDGNDLSAGVSGKTLAYGVLAGIDPWGGTGISEFVNLHIQDNILKVSATWTGADTGTDGIAEGIHLEADTSGVRFGDCNRNNLSAGVSGKWEAYGIHLVAPGDSGIEEEIKDNILKVTSISGYAAGIDLHTSGPTTGVLTATIVGNNLSAGVSGLLEAYGIRMRAVSNITNLTADLNSMLVTSTGGSAYGISGSANDDIINSSITCNNLLAGVKGKYDAVGIYLYAAGDIIGDPTSGSIRPVVISENQMKVTSTNTAFTTATPGYDVSGILLEADYSVLADVLANDITVSGSAITGPPSSYVNGICLFGDLGDVGYNDAGTYHNCTIADNSIAVTNLRNALNTSGAVGVYLMNGSGATGYVLADVFANYLTVKAYREASGGRVFTLGSVGNGTNPFTFERNLGTVNGTLTGTNAERWLLYLQANGGNVTWYGNSVTPVTGGWTGNYPASGAPNSPVEENVYTGTINP